MTVVKLKLVDRALVRVSYFASKLAGKTGSKLCKAVDLAIANRMFVKYVPESVRAAGKMNASLSFNDIRY